MTFEEILNQALAMLQRQGRVSYRALKRQFDLDDAYIEELKFEIIEVHRAAVDQDNTLKAGKGRSAALWRKQEAASRACSMNFASAWQEDG